ncbi:MULTISPECIES: TetR/AcrR family transcriptional regulator [unclassified Pseudofrankia]|uniref:TetR/AcrR family transcriptional regulator n=1 Tax=unclassified Pseudofrankia TaxID=2994372 RepID=UPI001F52124D|nr:MULTISPECIES: TetR/AcrR family transcriptional regulator [unclassified Pseudofrankia]MDT3444557.1 helix-turn-helix domain-containing protein [Pseudofrankia sp. BMG5.37]
MGAAVSLVVERGTSAVGVSDIARAADVSRQLLYQQFGDRDTLLLEAALDLARRELVPSISEAPDTRTRVLATTQHFAHHRSFYRAMMTGPCSYELSKVLQGVLHDFNAQLVLQASDRRLPADLVEDLTGFVIGGWAAIFNSWVVDGPDPLDAEAFADRLMRLLTVLTVTIHTEPEPRR